MNPVDSFIIDYPHEDIKELMLVTHQLLLDFIPNVKVGIKWNVPFYTYKTDVCFMNPKQDHLILGLINGPWLKDPHRILTGEQKLLRHYIIRSIDDLSLEAFYELIKDAILIQEENESRK